MDVEEFVYDPNSGSLLQSKSISGLISNFTYDGLGRLIKTQLPDNTVNTITYQYISNPPAGSYLKYSKTGLNGRSFSSGHYTFNPSLLSLLSSLYVFCLNQRSFSEMILIKW